MALGGWAPWISMTSEHAFGKDSPDPFNFQRFTRRAIQKTLDFLRVAYGANYAGLVEEGWMIKGAPSQG